MISHRFKHDTVWCMLLKNRLDQGIIQDTMTKVFSIELEKVNWLTTLENQSVVIGNSMYRYCHQSAVLSQYSDDHPISIDDTRLGIPLSEQQTSDGWVTVEGLGSPELDALSMDELIYVSTRCSVQP